MNCVETSRNSNGLIRHIVLRGDSSKRTTRDDIEIYTDPILRWGLRLRAGYPFAFAGGRFVLANVQDEPDNEFTIQPDSEKTKTFGDLRINLAVAMLWFRR